MSFSKSPLSNVALVLIAGLGAASPLRSQQPPDQQAPPPQASSDQQQAPPPSQSASPAQQQVFTQDQLNQLLGPIALYPDALVAIILPASTVPSDIVLAHRYLKQNGDANQVTDQPWDNSVKSLVRYPDVLNWMDQNLQWTTSLGQAFMAQPADVMNAVQALRSQAKANGNLASNSQQQVVQAQSSIVIQPAQPDTIYVPQYDPGQVYSQSYSDDSGPPETFGVGFSTGPWLNYGCSWGGDPGIYSGNWNGGGWNGNGWNNGGGGGYYGGGYGGTFVNISHPNRWRPSQSAWHQHQQFYRNHSSSSSSTHVSAHHTSVHVTTPSRFRVSGAHASASHTSVSHTNMQTKGGTEVNSTSVHHHDVSGDALHPTTAPHVHGESAGKVASESHATASHSSEEAEHTHSHTSSTSENSSGQTVHHHHSSTSGSTEAASGSSHTHSEASSETTHHHSSGSGQASEVHHSSESSGGHHSSGSSSSEVHHSSQSSEVHHSSAPAEQHHSAPQHASSGGQSHQSSGHSGGGGGSDKGKDKKN